jgi:hypothetical protein
METISIAGAEIYYGKNCFGAEDRSGKANNLRANLANIYLFKWDAGVGVTVVPMNSALFSHGFRL